MKIRTMMTRAAPGVAAAFVLLVAMVSPLEGGELANSDSLAGAARVYPITLEIALRLADERNTEIARHLEELERAVLAEKAAYMEWLPTIRAGGSYVKQDGALQSTGGGVANVNRDATYAGLGAGAIGSGLPSVAGASVEIDLAKAIFEPLAAKQRKVAAQAADEATHERVLLEVAEAFYRLVRAHQAIAISQDAMAEAGALAKVTGNFADSGEGLVADAERAAVEELLMEAAVEEARGDKAEASAALARLLRLDDALRLEPANGFVVPLTLVDSSRPEEECLAQAIAHRPELREQQALVLAARAALRERKFGPLIPKLQGAYSYGDFDGGASGTPDASGDRHDLGVAVYWQIDGLGLGQRNKAKMRQSELRDAELEAEQQLSDVIAEVKAAHGALLSAERRFSITKRAIARARRAHQLNRERIFENEGLPLEAMAAMQSLMRAEELNLRAATDYNLAQLRLHRAMGSELLPSLETAAEPGPTP